MTAELHDHAPPNAEAFVIAWLKPLAGGVNKVGVKRWAAGDPLPYRLVTRIAGADDGYSIDNPVVSVHTFAANDTDARREADLTHRRMMLLAYDPTHGVTMADNSTAFCEFLETVEGPREEPYSAESVVARLVARYRLGLSFVAV